SISPSPITTVPRIGIVSKTVRIDVVAASSASFFNPLPVHLAEDKAAASVTRTNSIVKLLSIVFSPLIRFIFKINSFAHSVVPFLVLSSFLYECYHLIELTFLSCFHNLVQYDLLRLLLLFL